MEKDPSFPLAVGTYPDVCSIWANSKEEQEQRRWEIVWDSDPENAVWAKDILKKRMEP